MCQHEQSVERSDSDITPEIVVDDAPKLRHRVGSTPATTNASTPRVRWRERESPRPRGIRIAFTHTILIVAVLAIAAMLGGGIILYLRAVYALELGVKELSQKETDEIANKLRQSFSAPIKNGEALRNYYYHTTDKGIIDHTTEDVMETSVKYHSLSSIQSSSVIQEVGVVLLPKHLKQKQDDNDTSVLQNEDLAYSHVWYDILENGTRQYIHAHYFPGRQEINRTLGSKYYGRPLTVMEKINVTTGEVYGKVSKPFSPDAYVNNTLKAAVFPNNLSSSTDIEWSHTQSSRIDLTIDTENVSRLENFTNKEWREPQMWISEDDNYYAFCAWDSVLVPPQEPQHPFYGYGAVQISAFFIFYEWDDIVSEHRDNETLVVVFDRHHQYVYSPTNRSEEEGTPEEHVTLRALACAQLFNETNAESHNNEKMATCSRVMNETTVFRDIKANDDGTDKFDLVWIDGEQYYVSYKGIYHSNTTNAYGTSTRLDVAVVWARKSSIVRAQITRVITILIIFVVGVFVMFVILFAAQLVIIGRPMNSLVKATEAMAALHIEEAKEALDNSPCDCSVVKVREVEALTRSFRRTLRFMAEYKAFMPQGLACDTSETEGDDMSVEHAPDGGIAPPPRPPRPSRAEESAEKKDAKTLERLQQIGLKRKVGSVLEARFDKRDLRDEDAALKSVDFVNIVLATVKRHGGIMLQTSPAVCIATWNTHNSCHRHAHQACACAMEIKKRALKAGLKMSSVVATGSVMAGSVGDNHTRAVAASGGALDVVQNASHLCSYLGVSVLISGDTFDRVRAHIDARCVDKVVLDDFALPSDEHSSKMLLMYEVKGEIKNPSGLIAPRDDKGLYNEGWTLFSKGHFKEARVTLEPLEHSDDRQASRLLNLSRLFEQRTGSSRGDPYVRRSRMPWEDFELQLPSNEQGWYGQELSHVSDVTETDAADEGEELEQVLRKKQEDDEAAAFRYAPVVPQQSCHSAPDYRKSVGFSMRSTLCNSIGIRTVPTDPSHLITTACSEAYVGCDTLPSQINTTKGHIVYSSGKVLGEGSYGKVYVGMTPDGELIALKALNVSYDMIYELVMEVSVLSKIRHEHIVAYHGSAVLESTIVICMEYMPGGSLAQLLQQFGSFNASTVKRYTKDMLKGLHFLHEEQIMHRDLKPGNVLVCSDGTCKLADFGTCASLAGGGAMESGVEGAEPMVGTPLYMSPEVIQAERDIKSDIWSFGITMAELLFGRVPYDVPLESFSPVAFVYQVGLRGLRPTIPQDTEPTALAILKGCLEEKPSDRPTCLELLSMVYFTN